MSQPAKTSSAVSEHQRTSQQRPIAHDCTPSLAPRPQSRWPGANWFRNPFGELTRSERAELAVVSIDEIVAAIGHRSDADGKIVFQARCAYQLIGECGRGKTTRMLALHKRFPSASYVYLPEDQPCPSIPTGDPLLIDEAQRLPWRIRRKVLASGVPLVVATHNDLSGPLRRAGYTVTTERIGLSLSVTQLTEILNRRITASRRDPLRPVPRIGQDDAAELIRRFGTDVRSIESYLYDIVQAQVNQHGEMRFID
ncbi:hypothetical protein [Stieleria mannarensis]|uniref:hypothetical protein n=1 Tax=Stieleria mannarensis TaxID=2755585 RepID=UPI001603A371|nr:hypothetical protein [Rhodopirellula sp. JC639]